MFKRYLIFLISLLLVLPVQAISSTLAPSQTWWTKTRIATIAVGGALLALAGLGGGAYLYNARQKDRRTKSFAEANKMLGGEDLEYESVTENKLMPNESIFPSVEKSISSDTILLRYLHAVYEHMKPIYFLGYYDATSFNDQLKAMKKNAYFIGVRSLIPTVPLTRTSQEAEQILNEIQVRCEKDLPDTQFAFYKYWDKFLATPIIKHDKDLTDKIQKNLQQAFARYSFTTMFRSSQQ